MTNHHSSILAAFAVSLAVVAGAHAQRRQTPTELPGGLDVPDCVHVTGNARYGALAYDHIVTVQNQCDYAVSCVVGTDVNPAPQSVRVDAGHTEMVSTFRGSPAREFTPRARCTR